ncbi:MAG: DNA/RNA nuclease SfsA [Rhizobiales bacterium]|nr:DNA/RNA nuclease SfsA [Hyphomicrobiales bacterium]MBI3673075.1 DNA/RNA nuclease SfsA [Hyphomicrobiales bacterium]
MHFASPLIAGSLVKRYKRFLADIILDTGETVTAACPNTGAMLGLNEPGSRVFLSRSERPTRKYPHSWELVELPGRGLVGVNTGAPNRIAAEAIGVGLLSALAGYSSLRQEVKYGRNSRIDILLEGEGRSPCYVEVKNAHLFRKPGLVEFPDCVTERGTKHLHELADMVRAGHRAVMVYLVQAHFPSRFALAEDLDPTYFKAFRQARQAGVEAYALCCNVTPEAITAARALPVEDCE